MLINYLFENQFFIITIKIILIIEKKAVKNVLLLFWYWQYQNDNILYKIYYSKNLKNMFLKTINKILFYI